MMEEFAARFAGAHRVIVMTRRGFGRSSMPREGYELAERVEDIRALLDELHVRRAVLIGHSIAGDELTAFATKYPDRVIALVYLDAAYDRADPATPQPTASVWQNVLKAWTGDGDSSTSLDAYRASQRRTFFGIWTAAQEKNLKETIVTNVDGTVSSRTPSWIPQAISQSDRREKLQLTSVKQPALMIFARQRLELRGLQLDSATKAGLIRDEDAYEAYFSRYLEKLRRQPNFRITVVKQTMHHLYLEKPDEVARLIRDFLATVHL